MRTNLEELQTVAGVVGSYLFSLRQGVLASTLPPLFRTEKLQAMGRLLARIQTAGRGSFNDLSEITLVYEEFVLIVREAQAETLLVVIAEPGYNSNLLTLALNTTLNELPESSGTGSPASPRPGKPAHTVDSLLAEGPLAAPLMAMQTLLAKVMGPIAPIIFRETAEEWLTRQAPSRSALPALFDLLAREIGDPEKVRTYRQLIAPHLQGPSKS
ncbi:hypothetical protein JCM30471_07480 [Desulfuromonas carbonis]|uniref:hypothetical protein n=1 Tax=Desulfuromonas sp. DDH964 TaxID=1823759 RepID=UPI00078BDBC6|nr:hypothetical protein [Desulfuromonas sp. DDH964]AMV72264.1 hypothetical protein DBW_1911 [Desulfuromonas sp. DDH964]